MLQRCNCCMWHIMHSVKFPVPAGTANSSYGLHCGAWLQLLLFDKLANQTSKQRPFLVATAGLTADCLDKVANMMCGKTWYKL